jgi:TatA/E family protein of Tat protein translocase
MLTQFGSTELIIILIIVTLLFGAGRISRIAKEAGQAISAFKSGLEENKEVISD